MAEATSCDIIKTSGQERNMEGSSDSSMTRGKGTLSKGEAVTTSDMCQVLPFLAVKALVVQCQALQWQWSAVAEQFQAMALNCKTQLHHDERARSDIERHMSKVVDLCKCHSSIYQCHFPL